VVRCPPRRKECSDASGLDRSPAVRPASNACELESEMRAGHETHVFRKGFYEGSDADYVCLFCGLEATREQVCPPETDPPVTPLKLLPAPIARETD
jgi:hypothetical protein